MPLRISFTKFVQAGTIKQPTDIVTQVMRSDDCPHFTVKYLESAPSSVRLSEKKALFQRKGAPFAVMLCGPASKALQSDALEPLALAWIVLKPEEIGLSRSRTTISAETSIPPDHEFKAAVVLWQNVITKMVGFSAYYNYKDESAKIGTLMKGTHGTFSLFCVSYDLHCFRVRLVIKSSSFPC